MSNLKELKVRINTVKSTKKITKVMKMVAAAKLRKAQKQALDIRSYSYELHRLISKMIATISANDWPRLLTGTPHSNTQVLFVIASDKGLCGGYNSYIIKQAKQFLHKVISDGDDPKIICIGKKVYDLLKGGFSTYITNYVEKFNVSYSSADELTTKAITNNDFKSLAILYTKFENNMVQTPTLEYIAPFLVEGSHGAEFECEGNKMEILNNLVLENFSVQLYRAMAESYASECVARMMAMDNATRNADEMINKLTLYYNRSRQAAITTELIEIISGAEAL